VTFERPEFLVETEWLAAHLDDPDLRILDCTIDREVTPTGARIVSGRRLYDQGHIPTSGYADFAADLMDRNNPLPSMMPPAEQFAEAMGRYGVGDGVRVILYDGTKDSWPHMWAARVWWMLRVFGFDNAAVLNGGIHKWRLEGRPISTAPATYPPAVFTVRHRPGLIAEKDDVLAALDDPATRLVNALPSDVHAGLTTTFARAGHIPGSVNVPTVDLVDPVTQAYLPPDQLRAAFESAGALDGERAITYCRAGIAASSDALILTLLGAQDVAVYDASLAEWAADPSLPLATIPDNPLPPAPSSGQGASEPRRS